MEVVESRSDATAPDVPVSGSWEPVHCRKCKRLLCRVTSDPTKTIRASQMMETKCPKCGSLNYLVGSVAE